MIASARGQVGSMRRDAPACEAHDLFRWPGVVAVRAQSWPWKRQGDTDAQGQVPGSES